MKMIKLFALATAALGLSISAPASAQSLSGILGLLNTSRNVGSMLGGTCSSGGLNQITCQAQRLNSVSQQFQYERQMVQNRQQQATQRQQQETQRQQRINEALARACRAGDEYSCDRAGPAIDPRASELQQALSEACDAGDRVSCERAQQVRGDIYAQQTSARR